LEIQAIGTNYAEDLSTGIPGRLSVIMHGIPTGLGSTAAAGFINRSNYASDSTPATTTNAHIGVFSLANSTTNEDAIAYYASAGGASGAGTNYSFYGASGEIHQIGAITSTTTITAEQITSTDDITVAGDINANGNIVGDGATDITNIESIYVDNVRADASGANNYINLASNDIKIVVNAKEIASFEDNTIVFNESSNDHDFRVESNGFANMLFVNAGTNQVSINSDTTSSPFEGDADRDFKHDSPFTVFATGELGNTAGNTVGMATFGYEGVTNHGSYLEFFGRRDTTDATGEWSSAGTRIQHVLNNVGQGYIEFNGEAGDYGLSLGTSASGTSVGAYISSPGIILDGDGAVTKPRQPLFSYFNQVTDPDVADPYTVEFNTENFDRGGDFESDTFTAPVAGIYQLGTAVRTAQLDASATYYNLRIITTLKTYSKLYDMAVIGVGDGHSSGYHTLEMNTLVEMDLGDTAYVSIDRSGGATQMDVIGNSSTPHTRFYGYLVA
jgi:hypothetical protein